MGTRPISLGRNFLCYNKKFLLFCNLQVSVDNLVHLILSGQLMNVV